MSGAWWGLILGRQRHIRHRFPSHNSVAPEDAVLMRTIPNEFTCILMYVNFQLDKCSA